MKQIQGELEKGQVQGEVQLPRLLKKYTRFCRGIEVGAGIAYIKGIASCLLRSKNIAEAACRVGCRICKKRAIKLDAYWSLLHRLIICKQCSLSSYPVVVCGGRRRRRGWGRRGGGDKCQVQY